MNLQELRIGNKLKVSNNYWTVSDILTNQNELYFKENNLTDYYLFAEPIELTEYILLKCGFEEKNSILEKDGIRLFKIRDLYFRGNFPIKADVRYLHQLQNLYYALTNEELNIEL